MGARHRFRQSNPVYSPPLGRCVLTALVGGAIAAGLLVLVELAAGIGPGRGGAVIAGVGCAIGMLSVYPRRRTAADRPVSRENR